MKKRFVVAALVVSALPASAAFVTLNSPDGLWSLGSDEFGSYGEGSAGSFAQRDFGTGLTGYSWQAAVLVTNGANSQWLAGPEHTADAGHAGTALGAGNLISDSSTASTRTSVFNGGAFPGISITLVQSATNAGISQQYSFTNTGAAVASFSVISFHDTDLDAVTFLNNTITSAGGALKVSDGTRDVYFSSAGPGYLGFLAAHVPGSGVTGGANVMAQNNFGIPGGIVNGFRDVTGGNIGADFDANADGVTDTPTDVGYLLQHNLSVPVGGTVTIAFLTSAVPEPATATLAAACGFLALARRRRD